MSGEGSIPFPECDARWESGNSPVMTDYSLRKLAHGMSKTLKAGQPLADGDAMKIEYFTLLCDNLKPGYKGILDVVTEALELFSR